MTNRNISQCRRAVVLASLLFACLAADRPMAQSEGRSAGVPALTGRYTERSCVPSRSTVCPEMSRAGAENYLTDRAKAFADAFDELAVPKYDCWPATLPGLFGDPYAFEIEQLEDRIIFTYEKDDIVRTVWLADHQHPEPRIGEFFTHGYSQGRYEGDELVVETGKFTFDPTGLAGDFLSAPSSTQKRLLERYSRNGDNLRMSLTVEDPIFLRQPINYVMQWRPSEPPLALPWNCDPAAAQRNLRLVPTKYPDDPPVVRRN
jgi:hypothetical protein